jgi:hypothetical protein
MTRAVEIRLLNPQEETPRRRTLGAMFSREGVRISRGSGETKT